MIDSFSVSAKTSLEASNHHLRFKVHSVHGNQGSHCSRVSRVGHIFVLFQKILDDFCMDCICFVEVYAGWDVLETILLNKVDGPINSIYDNIEITIYITFSLKQNVKQVKFGKIMVGWNFMHWLGLASPIPTSLLQHYFDIANSFGHLNISQLLRTIYGNFLCENNS